MKRTHVFGLVLFLFPLFCHAQYVVGGYRYTCPVGAPWNDPRCIREQVDEPGAVPYPQQPVQQLRWVETWGAIALDDATGQLGTGIRFESEDAAVGEAISRCERLGGKSCTTALTFLNQCAAVAWKPDGSKKTIFQSGATVKIAAKFALQKCEEGGKAKCEIVHSACSPPIVK